MDVLDDKKMVVPVANYVQATGQFGRVERGKHGKSDARDKGGGQET